MRNLNLLSCQHIGNCLLLAGAQCISVDCDTGDVFCARAKDVTRINPKTGELTDGISLSKGDSDEKVVGIHYLVEEQSLCIVLQNGNIQLWNQLNKQIECVGSVGSGITAMSWSPDLELLVLITGQDMLIMMTNEFDPIVETCLHTEDFGEAKPVSIGWGKKETQFHGSEGKAAAHRSEQFVDSLFNWDDRRPRISWRGDGQYFVISAVNPHTGVRNLRVWTREGTHHSTSEMVNGLEQSLCWKPSGSLITTTQRLPNRHDVVFFELNGLKHGEFTLPFDFNQVKVNEVLWNSESTVLCVWCEDLLPKDSSGISKTYIQLWTVNNYHWYLKQSLYFDGTQANYVVSVLWDPEHAYKMHIMTAEGHYFQYTWFWATVSSNGKTAKDQSLVAVIDGDKVLMSPMQMMVVPPPMCAYYLQMAAPVNQVVFAPQSSDVAIVLVDGTILVYTAGGKSGQSVDSSVKILAAGGDGFTPSCALPMMKKTYKIEGLKSSFLCLHHFLWAAADLFVFCGQEDHHHFLFLVQVLADAIITVRSRFKLNRPVYNLACSSQCGTIVIQEDNGSLFSFNPAKETMTTWKNSAGIAVNFPQVCPTMAVCHIGGEEVVLGLTERYRFYVNNIEVASNCTSFGIHNEFLLLTTLSHTCRCIRLSTKVQALPMLSDTKEHSFDECVRRVERGSRIVVVVPEATKLVLQMPRGNLETIHPRALVLSMVRMHLDRLQFKEALLVMRKHRININLLYDHNPAAFLNNVQVFIKQVESGNLINFFLLELQEEDVTVTMYKAAYHTRKPVEVIGNEDGMSKVDKVCDAVLKALCEIDENKYILSFLTAYVKKTSPELEKALMLIQRLKVSGETPQSLMVGAEDALKYLTYLVDVNQLYDVALGMYDFDLVLMVAEKSQKDPKEYLPLLNNLRQLETNYQRYTIDRQLKRYKKALEHLSKCASNYFSEFLDLVKEHHLYPEALKLFHISSPEYKQVATLCGQYLEEQNQHEEAGRIYFRAEEWQLALEAYKTSLNWRQALCMAARLNYDKGQEVELSRQLAKLLKDRCRHSEAAVLLVQYVEDIEEAIISLTEGNQWEEALRLIHKYKRLDLIETDLRGALIEAFGNQMMLLNDLRGDFEQYQSRLATVRQQKARLEFTDGGNFNDVDGDLFSDASSATGESVASRSSTYSQRSTNCSQSTGRSSRNKRKNGRKRWSLREGSQYEEFALVDAVAKIIKRVDDLREEIHNLLMMLVQFRYDNQAYQLQQLYGKFLSLLEKAIPSIWLNEAKQISTKQSLGPDTTANLIAQVLQKGGVLQSDSELNSILVGAPLLNQNVKWKLHILDQMKP